MNLAAMPRRSLVWISRKGYSPGHHTSGGPVRGRLDSIDWAILKELQNDGSITNVELARRVGLSAPPCLRRVRALETAGIIKAYRAMLDPKALGYEIVCFAMVQLDAQGKKELGAFQERIKHWSMVRECWILSGDIDFILKCVAPEPERVPGFRVGTHGSGERPQRPHRPDPRSREGRAAGPDRGRGAGEGVSQAVRLWALDTSRSPHADALSRPTLPIHPLPLAP